MAGPTERDPGRVPEGRIPEGASFETARVGGGRSRPPIFVLGFVAVLVGMIAVGVSGRLPEGGGVASASATPIAGTPTTSPTAQPRSPGVVPTPRVIFPAATLLTSEAGPFQLQGRRQVDSMFVHGDIYIPRVTWVFVSLQDDAGRVAGWASVSLPGAAGPAVGAGPTFRFDLELHIPAEYDGRLWVRATAYDAGGRLVASANLEAPPVAIAAAAGRTPDGRTVSMPSDAPIAIMEPGWSAERHEGDVLHVEGRLQVRAASLTVALLSSNLRVLDAVAIDTQDRDGGIRPVRLPTIELDLPLRESRAGDRLWVVVTAFDIDGAVIGTARRLVLVGTS